MMNDQRHQIYNQAFRQFIDERKKCHFFEATLNGILFEYTSTPSVIKLSSKASQKLGLPKTIIIEENGATATSIVNKDSAENLGTIQKILNRHKTPKDKPILVKQAFNIDGKSTPCNVKLLQIWTHTPNENPVLASAYGYIDILH